MSLSKLSSVSRPDSQIAGKWALVSQVTLRPSERLAAFSFAFNINKLHCMQLRSGPFCNLIHIALR